MSNQQPVPSSDSSSPYEFHFVSLLALVQIYKYSWSYRRRADVKDMNKEREEKAGKKGKELCRANGVK
jgi:hypothetical protein